MTMLVGALVLVWARLCWAAISANEGWTVEQLLESKQWRNIETQLILTEPGGSIPESFLNALVEAVSGSNVTHVKVKCPESFRDDDEGVCQSMINHSLAVRADGVVKGVDVSYESESEFVSAVLELLVTSSITHLWSYNDLTKFNRLHSQYLLTLAPNSEEYVALLSALIAWPMPLGVAMTAGVLPLSQRQHYSPPPTLLQLWYVVEGQHWYSNQDTTGFSLHVVQRCKKPVQLIREFVERVYHPIVIDYKDDATLRRQFGESGLHIAIVFPGLSGINGTEPESVAVSVAKATFMNYAFIIMPDRTLLSRFVKESRPYLHIILLPYGLKEDVMMWGVEGHHLDSEIRYIVYALRAYAVEKPKSQDSQVYAELGPSLAEVSEIKQKIANRKHHLFAYFCLQGSRQCLQTGYRVVKEVLSVIRVSKLGKSLGAHVVMYKSANVKPFKLKKLITCAMYNYTTKSWTEAKENISTGFKALHFISQLTNMSELREVARVMSHLTLTLADVPPPPKSLQEDDHFNLVAESMPLPSIPAEIQLTSSTFHQHIAKFSKTVVVFCAKWNVRCKVFLHYVVAAHEQLNKALNVSITTVGCDSDTELCVHYQVAAYPTVLIFTPSTINTPTPLGGTLDSTHLLRALGQTNKKDDNNDSLPELTPRSLPLRLDSCAGLNCTLVLWCDRDTSSDAAKAFKEQARLTSTPHLNLVFAWINSDEHSQLLYGIVHTATFPSVVAISFKQHSVHLLSVEGTRQAFEEKLTSFIHNLSLGTQDNFSYLADRAWAPLQPPVTFPSTTSKKAHRPRHTSATDHGRTSSSPSSEQPPSSHHPHTEL